MNILVINGSLRAQSLNKSVADYFAESASEGLSFEIADISNIPLYNQDEEENFPAVVTELKNKIKSADGVILVTPEYNRSFPGVLKNTVDWTSRPYGDSAWNNKPVAVTGISISPVRSALAQYDLKKVMNYLNARLMGQPELYLHSSEYNATGTESLDSDSKKYIKEFADSFANFIKNNS